MNCDQFHKCVPVGILVDLEGAEEYKLQQALRTCPTCRGRYAAALAQRSLLRDSIDVEASPDLWGAVRDRLMGMAPEAWDPKGP